MLARESGQRHRNLVFVTPPKSSYKRLGADT
jgi:hypothetical protein